MLNHIENLNCLCTKTGLIKSLRRYYDTALNRSVKEYNIFCITPTTFVVSSSCKDSEFLRFSQHFNDLKSKRYNNERMPKKHCKENMWLIKPAAENQGRGIKVFHNNLQEMKEFLQSKPINTFWIVQKYIEQPLLYYDRKFDIRMWAVITWKKEFYIYKSGYIRTSSEIGRAQV